MRLAGTAVGSSSAALPGALFQPPSLTKKPAKPVASKLESERKGESFELCTACPLVYWGGGVANFL